MRYIETDTASNVDIHAATAIGAYTADADRLIICDVMIDAVAGGGDYVMYVTKRINGAGSTYVILPKSTLTAAAGETAISGQSGMIAVRSGDVLTVLVDGLAGDTSTPDYTTRWFELAALRPATADRSIDVDANGKVILQATQTGVTIPTVTAVTNGVSIAAAQTVATVTDVTNAVKISAGTGAGQLDFTSGVVKSNLAQILGTALTETSGLIAAGFKKFFNVASPTGTVNSLPDAIPTAANGIVTGGTGTSQLSVSSGKVLLQSTQTGVTIPTVTTTGTATNVTNAVKVSAGTGSGQLDFTAGVVKTNLSQILGTALTETSGLIAAGFKKFFNIATPTGTVNSLPDAVPGANGGLPTQNGSKLNQTADLTEGQTIPTVTNLTNLPTMPADWVTASGLKADAVAEIADGVYDEAMAGHVGAGTAGKAIADILADTNELQTDLVNGGRLDLLVDAIKAKTDNLPASPAAVGSQMDLVNAPNATAVTAIQNGLSKPGTAQTITPPADMALNSTVAKDATVSKPATAQTIASNADITAIKGKTDQLVFTVANQVDVDVSGVAAAVWGYATRTLTSFGTLLSSIWTYGTRTLTSFGTMSGTTTTEINVIGPVRNDGKIDAIAGDDYYAADGRGMAWSDTAWPDLTGATVKFISGSTEITMTVVTPGTGEQVVSLDVPKATSLSMKGEFKFILKATLASTHIVTLLEGEGRFK